LSICSFLLGDCFFLELPIILFMKHSLIFYYRLIFAFIILIFC